MADGPLSEPPCGNHMTGAHQGGKKARGGGGGWRRSRSRADPPPLPGGSLVLLYPESTLNLNVSVTFENQTYSTYVKKYIQ